MSIDSVPEKVLRKVKGSTERDWHRHTKGGGWVYRTAFVGEKAYVGSGAIVYGNAAVVDSTTVDGQAQVFGDAHVADHARIRNNARVFGFANVRDYGEVDGRASVSGCASVRDHSFVGDRAILLGSVVATGNVRVLGGKWSTSPLFIQGSVHGVSLSDYDKVTIGCTTMTIQKWIDEGAAFGKVHGYSREKIAEYKQYLLLAKKISAGLRK